MKQLKFMLAAATAIGLATAAQAAVADEELSNEKFNSYNEGQAVIGSDGAALIDGFSYTGTAGDNESTIIKDSEGDMALKVNTGTDPLLRMIDTKNRQDVNLSATGFNYLNIDTMVQFTVTPESDTVMPGLSNPELKDEDGNVVLEGNIKEDKLLIYLQEKTVGETKSNVLTVWASEVQSGGDDDFGAGEDKFLPTKVEIPGVEVVPNQWYRLQVKTYVENGIVLFSIKLGDTELASSVALYSSATQGTKAFPSLLGKATTLTYVGFAGEGMVDDLVVTKYTTPTSVDFTFTLGDNVSAVSWTVDGEEQDSLTYSAAVGSTYDVVIKSVTYAPGYAGSKVWAGWTSTVTASTTVTIDDAEEFAAVTKDDEGNVTAVIPNDATVASVTTGSFAVPEDGNAEVVAAAKAELGKVLTWATSVGRKSYNQAIAAVKEMNFDKDGNPAVVGEDDDVADEEAFLLNCAPAELAAAKEAFSFPSFTPGEIPQATEGDFNGKVTLKGATALGSWFDVIKEQGDNYGKIFNGETYEVPSFFKSVLTLK